MHDVPRLLWHFAHPAGGGGCEGAVGGIKCFDFALGLCFDFGNNFDDYMFVHLKVEACFAPRGQKWV